MDHFLITLVMTLVAEMGDRTQWLLAVLLLRYHRSLPVLAGFVLATMVNCALAAAAGDFSRQLLAGPALLMFQAMAVIFAAAAMLWRRGKLDRLEGWRLPAFATAFLGCLILEFGDKSQFIVLAASANSGTPVLTWLGGVIGITVAAIPAFALPRWVEGTQPFAWLRIAGGVVFGLLGVILLIRVAAIVV
ncbi:MAG: TMEM165/GDT1 family protein [Sphingomonadales bacterium]|nr:TMEM165/GDT1 family protein [Sphingomonadales bacterium]